MIVIFFIVGLFTKRFLAKRRKELEGKRKRKLNFGVSLKKRKRVKHDTADEDYGCTEILEDIAEEELAEKKSVFISNLRSVISQPL